MTDITIPPEAAEAAARADYEAWRDWADLRDRTLDWEYLAEGAREGRRILARASIAAALSAWPGAELEHDIREEPRTIHLPIPEASDE